MKICWDNLERIIFKNGKFYLVNEKLKQGKYLNLIRLYFLESCKTCQEPFLSYKKEGGFCNKKCSNSGINNGMYGKHWEEENKIKMAAKLSKQRIGSGNPMYGKGGELSPTFGRLHTKEEIEKIKIGISEDSKKERSKRMIGLNNPMYKYPELPQLIAEKIKSSGSLSGENNPMFGKIGELSPAWKGGISTEPYCCVWTKEYKEEIKERDEYRCQNPLCNHKSNKLTCHHINYVKKDCHPRNLITLCNSCNSIANGNREWHEAFYNELIKRKYLFN